MDVYSTHSSISSHDTRPLLRAPVVVFYTGGAWIIGYKMWGSLLARALTAAGIVVVIPDMRNYPWGTVPDMVDDVKQSLQWTFKNISDYGGDPENVVVAGQSAGGHVVMTCLLRMAIKLHTAKQSESTNAEDGASSQSVDDEMWRPQSIKGFLSLSAPYNLKAMQASFSSHGLDDLLITRIFGNREKEYDPYQLVVQCQQENRILSGLLPPIRIFHGTSDKTAPCHNAEQFAKELNKIIGDDNVVPLSLYQGWSHTDPILEGPMDADHRFHRDLFGAVVEWTHSSGQLTWPHDHPAITQRLCPHFLINAGRGCMPF